MNTLPVIFEKDAVDFLTGLPAKQFKQVQMAIYRLMSNPRLHDSEALKGSKYKGLWRNDIGEYRIIYQYDEKLLTIVTIGKRNDGDVYRRIPT